MSLLPRILPLTELAVLVTPAIGVCGGVVHDRLVNDGFDAATLGTLPSVGVGLLVMTTPEFCDWGGCVITDDVEFDRVGLGG